MVSLHAEEQILLWGSVLALLFVFTIFVLTFVSPLSAGKLFSITTTHLLTGRAGGIATGIEFNIPLWTIAIISTAIDTIVVLIVYPLFIMISKKRFNAGILHKFLKDTERSAHKHRDTIEKYGMIGLLFFVWFPLHMTGPLAGSILGYFLGFSHSKTLITVIAGTALAVISWLYIFQSISEVLGKYSTLVPLSIITIAIGSFIIYHIRRTRRK